MRLTWTFNGQTVEGTIERAVQRCKAVTGWDDENDTPIRCGLTRHAHMVGAWDCGHDDEEGVLVVVMDHGAPGEITFATGENWSKLLIKAGL